MSWQHFDKNEFRYQALFWLLLAIMQTSIESATVIADYQRLNISINPWKAIVWESSSQFVGVLLILLIVWFDQKMNQLKFTPTKKLIGLALFSIIYSVSHVVGMVSIRKFSYFLIDKSYDFGNWAQELVYEYTKDFYSYIWIVAVIYAYRFIISRLRGEAKAIGFGEDNPTPEKPERLLVKKIGKEFIIKIEDIEWIEACGNYMNLHVKDKVYPLRETMSKLEAKLNPQHFARIHRSSIVNLDCVNEIQPLDTGDFQVFLNTGKQLKLSRRYREKVKGLLQ